MVGKPVLHLRQAHVEGIDVPSGDFHADSVCEGRLKSGSGFSGKIRTKQKRFMKTALLGKRDAIVTSGDFGGCRF